MIDNIPHLSPYPDYGTTEIPWLEAVPINWQVIRAKVLFTRMRRLVRPEDDVITAFRDGTVTLRKNRRTTGFTEALQEIGYQGIRKGDLVIHAMDAFAGAIGVSDSDGKGTPVYSVCQASRGAHSWYYALLLREMSRCGFLLSLAKGIRERSTDFRFADFASLDIPLPPLSEQTAIVRFLDHADGRIRRAIRAKQKLIKLLEEQKQAIIHRAVTRGLDPNVSLKPSGVEWLGDIPEHWEVKRLKHIVSINAKVLTETTPSDYEFNYLDIGTVSTGVLIKNPINLKFSNAPSRARRIIQNGDTIISTVRTYLKAIYYVEGIIDNIICSTGFAVLTPKIKMISKYISYMVQSNAFMDKVTANSVGIAYPAIAESRLGSLKVLIPPYNEQATLVNYLDEQFSIISSLISSQNNEISLLREYRTRLIADVVTGKLDVREAAESLPEEAADPVMDDMDEEDAVPAEPTDTDDTGEADE